MLYQKLVDWLKVPDRKDLRRCKVCEYELVSIDNPKTAREHAGHRLYSVHYLHVNEWLRLRLGWL